MSDSFRQANGRKVVSRASARDLGAVSHLLVDAGQRRIAAVVVGRGKRAQVVEWGQLSFGPDAVMLADEGSLRPPGDARERAGAEGKLEMVGKRALTELGTELGTIHDVSFDAGTGALEMLRIGERDVPPGSLLGSGPYAVVVDSAQEPDT